MSDLTVALASDHAGYALKQMVADAVRGAGQNVLDLGPDGTDSVDYPEFGFLLGRAIEEKTADYGIAICGSGIGISIAVNRFPAARAALCTSSQMARLARQHNDANVLALGERLTGVDVALECVHTFLSTKFEGGRHARRVQKLSHPDRKH
ncbi:MAG: ribose 5-phosphate isomerase B [Pseudomonadota bacterium]